MLLFNQQQLRFPLLLAGQLSEGCFTDARASRRKEKRRGRAPALNAGQAGQRIGGNRAAGCKCGSMFQHRMRVLLRSECTYTHGERGEARGQKGSSKRGPQGQARQQRNSSNALPSGWGLSKGDKEEETAPRVAYRLSMGARAVQVREREQQGDGQKGA